VTCGGPGSVVRSDPGRRSWRARSAIETARELQETASDGSAARVGHLDGGVIVISDWPRDDGPSCEHRPRAVLVDEERQIGHGVLENHESIQNKACTFVQGAVGPAEAVGAAHLSRFDIEGAM